MIVILFHRDSKILSADFTNKSTDDNDTLKENDTFRPCIIMKMVRKC